MTPPSCLPVHLEERRLVDDVIAALHGQLGLARRDLHSAQALGGIQHYAGQASSAALHPAGRVSRLRFQFGEISLLVLATTLQEHIECWIAEHWLGDQVGDRSPLEFRQVPAARK